MHKVKKSNIISHITLYRIFGYVFFSFVRERQLFVILNRIAGTENGKQVKL